MQKKNLQHIRWRSNNWYCIKRYLLTDSRFLRCIHRTNRPNWMNVQHILNKRKQKLYLKRKKDVFFSQCRYFTLNHVLCTWGYIYLCLCMWIYQMRDLRRLWKNWSLINNYVRGLRLACLLLGFTWEKCYIVFYSLLFKSSHFFVLLYFLRLCVWI